MTDLTSITAVIEPGEGGFYVTLQGHDAKAGPYPSEAAAEEAVGALVEATLRVLIERSLTGGPQ